MSARQAIEGVLCTLSLMALLAAFYVILPA